MLSHVAIKNFKSIGEPGVELELKPLTILVGPNGSGKSSILESMLLAWHGGELKSGTISAPWLYERLQAEWLLHKRRRDSVLCISVVFGTGKSENGQLCFSYTLTTNNARYHWGLLPSKDGLFSEPPPNVELELWQRLGSKSRDTFEAQGRKVFFVSGSRGNVPIKEDGASAGHQTPDTHHPTPGTHGENLLTCLGNLFGSNEYSDAAARIVNWAESFGISELKAGLRPEGGRGADYIDPDLHVTLQMALASTGARQVLTVIAHLFGSEPGSLILIEEPEISLHPEAQVKLVEMFAEVINQGKQLILTTHSHYLLLALTEAVQRKLIKSEEVSVWEITKQSEKGTVAKELPITEEGVIKGWVSSFAKVDAQLLKGRTRPASRVRR
jgi:hypothetical protein